MSPEDAGSFFQTLLSDHRGEEVLAFVGDVDLVALLELPEFGQGLETGLFSHFDGLFDHEPFGFSIA